MLLGADTGALLQVRVLARSVERCAFPERNYLLRRHIALTWSVSLGPKITTRRIGWGVVGGMWITHEIGKHSRHDQRFFALEAAVTEDGLDS